MKPGSVVIDLAGEAGGNCELSQAGERVVARQRRPSTRRSTSPRRWPSTPRSSTRATSWRCSSCSSAEDGSVSLDFEDEIIAGACVTRGGEIVHEGAKKTVEAAA